MGAGGGDGETLRFNKLMLRHMYTIAAQQAFVEQCARYVERAALDPKVSEEYKRLIIKDLCDQELKLNLMISAARLVDCTKISMDAAELSGNGTYEACKAYEMAQAKYHRAATMFSGYTSVL